MKDDIKKLKDKLEVDMLRMYGSPMISGEALQKALGYKSMDALRQGISRQTIPVKVFEIENRRGKYALISDIAQYLAEQSSK